MNVYIYSSANTIQTNTHKQHCFTQIFELLHHKLKVNEPAPYLGKQINMIEIP